MPGARCSARDHFVCATDVLPRPDGILAPYASPNGRPYARWMDRWSLSITASTGRRSVGLIGQPAIATDARFRDTRAALANRSALLDILADASFRERPPPSGKRSSTRPTSRRDRCIRPRACSRIRTCAMPGSSRQSSILPRALSLRMRTPTRWSETVTRVPLAGAAARRAHEGGARTRRRRARSDRRAGARRGDPEPDGA